MLLIAAQNQIETESVSNGRVAGCLMFDFKIPTFGHRIPHVACVAGFKKHGGTKLITK